jgi:hypothetical protein
MEYKRDKKRIEELYSLYKKGDLQLQPFFQRNLVWTDKAKSQFIESILLELPISEIYLYEDESGILSVIDGQQRLSTIFHFLEKKFILKGLEKLEQLNGSDASFSKTEKIKKFEIFFVKIDKNVSRGDIIDTYSRINRYTVNLNAQELRRATYSDSDFLKLSEKLAELEFFQYGRFFTERKRERMNDVEFVSELLACQINGIQDKKNKLDDFYKNYTEIPSYDNYQNNFIDILQDIKSIFDFSKYFCNERTHYDGSNPAKNIGSTRYKQQADFYSFFYLLKKLREEKIILNKDQKEAFLKSLLIYNKLISPESYIDILSTYAVKCVSQGNTKNSREFRYNFLRKSIDYILTKDENDLIAQLKYDFMDIYDYDFDPLNIDLDEFILKIENFEEEMKENA